MLKARTDRVLHGAFILLCGLVVIDRAWMVWITAGHASDDMAVVWLGTTDYAKGIFHEPFFYGQDYGVMLEALLGAPFVWLGCDPVATIAIVFGLFAILPYLAFAVHHHLRGEHWPAMLYAAMPLLLPVEHGLQVTALNGIAVLALVPFAERSKQPFRRGFLLFMVLSLAVLVNPNAALLALPLGMNHALQHHREKGSVIGMVGGMAPAMCSWFVTRWYFHERSSAITNTIFDWRMHFKPYMIPQAWERLEQHFAWTAPLGGTHDALAPLLLLGAIVALFVVRRTSAAWATLATFALIILSFSFAKVHDGADSIFFPLSRIFLGMPLLLAWTWGRIPMVPRVGSILVALLCMAALANGILRMTKARDTYATALAHQDGLPVRTRPVQGIRADCALVTEIAEKAGAQAIILMRDEDAFTAQFLAYGIPVFHPEAPMTWMAGHDRRTFQRTGASEPSIRQALVVGGKPVDITRIMGRAALLRAGGPTVLLVRTNGDPASRLVARLMSPPSGRTYSDRGTVAGE